MSEISFEETCPCGNAVKISGYAGEVRNQIQTWHHTHDKHANAAAKKKATEDYDVISVNVAEPVFGAQIGKRPLRTHSRRQCRGPLDENDTPICCIHNPSNHHMVTWPQNWRGDKGIMERICPCGTGHPDPDDFLVRTTEWANVHGCCGCCKPPSLHPVQTD